MRIGTFRGEDRVIRGGRSAGAHRRAHPRAPRRALPAHWRTSIGAAIAAALACSATGIGPATAPASAAVVVHVPQLTLRSTYTGTLLARAQREPAPGEVEDLKVKEEFTVKAEQRVDNEGDTIVLRAIAVEGSETGTVPDGAGGTEGVGCTLSAGEGHRAADFRPAGALAEPEGKEEIEEGKGEAFVGNPATDYAAFHLRTFMPTDSLGEPANEVAREAVPATSARSCAFAKEAGGFVKDALLCKGEAEAGGEGDPFAPEASGLFESPPSEVKVTLNAKCSENASGAKETVTVEGTVTFEAEGGKAVREAKEKEEQEAKEAKEKAEKEAKEAEEKAQKEKEVKEAEERKRAEEEAKKLEVPKPPAPPAPPPPAEAPPEAIVAPEGPAPKKLTRAQLRRLARTRTSPADRKRNRALRSGLQAATRVKAAKCIVALATDGALDAVTFVNAIPGETTAGGAVTDARTRSCLRLLAQTRASLAVAISDPPSPRFAAIALPAHPGATARAAAGASLPCLPSALSAAQYAACSGLAAADRESDRHLERVALVSTAVAGTINRHSGAILAGRQADAEFQNAAYAALIAELGQALERGNEANLALARAYAGAGTDIAFGHPLTSHTPRHVERLVRRAKGATRPALRTLLGALQLAVPSLPRSYRAALAAPMPVGALADGGTLRPRQLISLIRQLIKQGQVPAGPGAAMVSQLTALKKAKGAAATSLRRSLGASFRALTSEAGPLLEAATRIRSPRL
jgi:hypothetical protein